MRHPLGRWSCALVMTLGIALGVAAPSHAGDSKPIFGSADVQRYCEGLGGTFTDSEWGWLCTLPNGDQVWCDYISTVCGYTDRGKPAPKPVRKRHAALATTYMMPALTTSQRAVSLSTLHGSVRTLIASAKRSGSANTDSLRATCAKVDQLIEGYEDVLEGGGLFGGAVDTVPGLRQRLLSGLKDAREFKRQVCEPVLG